MKGWIAWDCNERSLDGFNSKLGWVRVDLSKLFHIQNIHAEKEKA